MRQVMGQEAGGLARVRVALPSRPQVADQCAEAGRLAGEAARRAPAWSVGLIGFGRVA